ncbi:16S rRNA (adenine(1518)-N(6)/adenine(1519)-N(6))-dimethyltransferase RsmA [Candidatus Pelagibacter sp.]|nr:16S rRNA (adenine(1518)-N(6)/adenine(1519)-N(6))-dimethyltransferase RsmA [Candidatus Pelagibacter sp.]
MIRPKKSLGQNFLNNGVVLDNIVNNGNINKDDIILEIGPGTGKLTEKIVKKKPSKIIVVEKDKALSDFLKTKFGDNIKIINEDILEYINILKFDKPIKVFGNLPYNISTKILTSIIKKDNLNNIFSLLIFVFQKEVADRIVAEYNTKQYGRLSILSSWKMYRKKMFDISPKNFFPIPKVWSSLVLLKPRDKIDNLKKSKNLEHITNIFFNQKRKMIKKPMKQLFINYEIVAKKLQIDLNNRPQNLSVSNYLEICKFYENLN